MDGPLNVKFVCLVSSFFTSTARDNISLSDSRFAALLTLAFSKFHSLFVCFTPVLWRGALLIQRLSTPLYGDYTYPPDRMLSPCLCIEGWY